MASKQFFIFVHNWLKPQLLIAHGTDFKGRCVYLTILAPTTAFHSSFFFLICGHLGLDVLDFIGKLPAISPIVFLRFQITAHGTGGGLVALVCSLIAFTRHCGWNLKLSEKNVFQVWHFWIETGTFTHLTVMPWISDWKYVCTPPFFQTKLGVKLT